MRAISGEKTGFAYSDDIDAVALAEAAKSARAIARDGRTLPPRALVRSGAAANNPAANLYPALDPIDGLGNEDKVEA